MKLIFKINKSSILLYTYLFLSLLIFIFFALPILNGEVNWNMQFYSDSKQYEYYFDLIFNKNYKFDFVSSSSNLLGPLIILWFFQKYYFLIYILNCLLFVFSLRLITKSFNLNNTKFFVFMMISPIMLSSLLSVNKEILSLLAIASILYYFKFNKVKYLVLALIASILTRWQLTFVLIIFIILLKYIDKVFTSRILVLIALLLVISIVYPLSIKIFSKVESVAREGELSNEGSGLYSLFLQIQRNFGYFIVFIPKTLHQLIGILARFNNIFAFKDFYNDVIIILQSLAFLVQLIVLFFKKIIFKHPAMYLATLYCMIFALSPIFAPRYFFPVYILFAIYLSDYNYRNEKTFNLSEI